MFKAQVVIQTAFLGDLILSIPFLQRVKSHAPEQKLVLVCKKGLGDFLKQQRVIDEFVEINKGQRDSYQQAAKLLSDFQITNLYCVHRSLRSLLFCMKLKAEKKIGFRSGLGFLAFHESYVYEKSWPDAIRKFKLLSAIDHEVQNALQGQDFAKLNTATLDGEMPVPPELFAFSKPGPVSKKIGQVCVFPGSVWATKRWTHQGFIQLVRALVEKKYDVLLLGGPDEKELCESIASQVAQVRVLAGQLSIQESIEKVGESSLVIANDSAATHMAALKNIPSITLFGPTTLNLGFRPWSEQARVVQIDLNCRPCGAHGHQQCPLGHHHCMKWISPERVIAQALDILKS